MSGPVKNLAEGWRLIRKHIKTDEPAPVGQYLGCSHKVHDVKDSAGKVVARRMEYDMEDFLSQCVTRYLELAGDPSRSLRRVATPFIEEALRSDGSDASGADDHNAGVLQPIACRVLMKVLYAARMSRFDLLRATCSLATHVTKWTRWCDKALHRLIC